jgi:hypothetical protein
MIGANVLLQQGPNAAVSARQGSIEKEIFDELQPWGVTGTVYLIVTVTDSFERRVKLLHARNPKTVTVI